MLALYFFTYFLPRKQFPNAYERLVKQMARKKVAQTEAVSTGKGYTKGQKGVSSLLNQLSNTLYGTNMRDETEDINDRFNDIMSNKINELTGNGSNTFDTFLGKVYSSDRDESTRVMDSISSKHLQLDNLGIINPSEFITEQDRKSVV